MGSDNSASEVKPKYLPQSEIAKENTIFLRELFKRNRNSNGYLDLFGLSYITNNLIDKSNLEIILKMCSSRNNNLSYNDFLYYNALLKTKIFDSKLNFIIYFIFMEDEKQSKDIYINKVNKYYKKSFILSYILLDENIINTDIIEKSKLFAFIKDNFKEEIENYQLNKEICDFIVEPEEMKKKEEKTMNENKNDKKKHYNVMKKNFNKCTLNYEINYCLCMDQKNSLMSSMDFYRMNSTFYNQFNSLKGKFEEYKKLNNGFFPITLLEDMLKEINIIPSLIDLINNFISKKALKEIISFELFKEVLSILAIPLDDDEDKERNKQIFTDGLFLLFSYPNDYIEKTEFCKFIQLTKNDNSFKSINNLLNKYEIQKKIYKEKFKELIDYLINELIESLEHIKYLPYIFFDFKSEERKIEKNCIDVLLNGKNIQEYIISKMENETEFFVIDSKFWENWNKLINSNNYEELNNIKIHTENICNQNGIINEGLVYLNDYIILTKRIYDLFCTWYGKPLIEIKREKIIFEDENENNHFSKLNVEDKDKMPLLQIEDLNTHKIWEIEIFPIFLHFVDFQILQIKCQNSLSKFKEEIKFKLNDKYTSFDKYSRKEKFSNILKILQKNVNADIDEKNSRLWIYYQEFFGIVNYNESLEKKGIYNKAVIILEINKTGTWPMDEFESIKAETKNKDIAPFGIMNIGNSCYMNSVLQVLLNISEIKEIFMNMKFGKDVKFLNFLINYKSGNYKLVEEFFNLLIDKWIERKNTLSPKKFKEICGRINPNFKGFVQQDANDFFNFLIQNLHEGTNLKTGEINVLDKESNDTNENELANEYWSNTVRNNASYFYSLFFGQLQSKLTCNKCHKHKIKYEPFSILDLPLPEKNNIILFIKLFRLPLKLSSFNDDNSQSLKKITATKIKLINYKREDIQQKKTTDNEIKRKYDININEQSSLEIETRKKLESLSKNSSKDELISNNLHLNIPILLKIEISRNEQCEEIISTLKSMDELALGNDNQYTRFIMITNNQYINPYLTIDQALQSTNQIDIYELLNYEGIKNIFNYNDLIDEHPLNLNYHEISSTVEIGNPNAKKDMEELEFKEILIEVKHRVRQSLDGDKYLINMPIYDYFKTYRDFIILANQKSIKIYDLYEMIWEKYMYFCDIPAKFNNILWWRNCKNENKANEKENIAIKFCSPFLLKVIDKTTKACEYCPWYRICTGCILDPNYKEYISIPKNCYLIVEWCRRVKFKRIKEENPLLFLNHSSLNNKKDEEQNDTFKKTSIYDCLDLFTEKEIVENIYCENCASKTDFYKILKIERIPKYLIISLKRFKYTIMYKEKINSPIKFPLNIINLNKYLLENSNESSKIYNLFAVVNHTGTLSIGHYNSIIKLDDTWINFNDSKVSPFTNAFNTQEAYILIYKYVKDDNKLNFKFNFYGLMDTAFRIYLKQFTFKHLFNYLINQEGEIIEEYEDNCKYYYGEPVKINNKEGYLINIFQKEDTIYAKIKIDNECLNIKYEPNLIEKETIKDNNITKMNVDNGDVMCNSGCYIF